MKNFLSCSLFVLVTFLFSTVSSLASQVNFYTSIPKKIAVKIAKEFEKGNPGTKVKVYRSGASKIMTKLDAEREAGRVLADVVWLADPGNTIYLKNKGMLLKYIPKNSEKVAFKDPEGYYIAGRIIAPVIAFNPSIVKSKPLYWKDLISKDYRKLLPSPWNEADGWCAIPNPLYSGSAVAFVFGTKKLYGEKYLKSLRSNGVVVLKSNGVVKNAIIQGQSPIGVTLDYMVRQQKAKGMSIDYIYPEEGTVLIPSPIAILKTTKNPLLSKTFVDFLLSKDVQDILADNYIIPARKDIVSSKVPLLKNIKTVEVDWNKLSQQLKDVRKEFYNIMLK